MKRKNGFSYRPYIPFKAEAKEIYICRLAPSEEGVEAEWLAEADSACVHLFQNGKEIKTICVEGARSLSLTGLEKDAEYTLSVTSGKQESCVRPFKTGDYHGRVVNYLHKEDGQFAEIGHFLGSPSIVRWKGDLYVSMDIFRTEEGTMNCSYLFRSKDDGKSWEYVTDLAPCEWGRLFVAEEKLCMLATTGEGGSVIVSCTEDGYTWATPTLVAFGSSGKYAKYQSVTSPTAYVEYNGKLYFSYYYGGLAVKDCRNGILECDLSKGVLNPAAWTAAEPLQVQFEWNADSDGELRYSEEGNIVERDGEIFNIMRFAYGRALMGKLEGDTCAFYKVIDFPVGHCKFFISGKQADGYYYAMGTDKCYPRERIELLKSKNLEEWEEVKVIDDISDLESGKNGIQYPSFLLEDGKFYTVIRTALNGADTFHNSNAVSFKIIELKK